MTKQRDKAIGDQATNASESSGASATRGISRRSLLRGGSLAAPAILTLNSNAAFGWAITSGTIGARMATGDPGNATCMVNAVPVGPDKPGVYYVDGADFIEVQGNPDILNPDILYNTAADGSDQMLTPDYVCEESSAPVYYSVDGGQTWNQVPDVLGGAVVSFAAVEAASFNPIDVPLWPNV